MGANEGPIGDREGIRGNAMKTTVIALAAASLLACLPPALAQPAANVTPAQIDAAEKAFQQHARAAFRSVRRSPGDRLGLVHTARASATAADLGATITLTPQAPYAAGKAWLDYTLGIVDTGDGTFAMMAYADDFAPAGALDVVIKTAPGKRYLVECSALTLGANTARATIFAGAAANATTQQLKQDPFNTATPGAVMSIVTPATTAEYLRVTLDIARAAINSSGQAVLVADKCEVTPFS